MKKYSKLFVVLVVIGLMFSTSTVRAEDDGENKDRLEWNNTMQAERKAFVEKLKTDRETFRAEVKVKKEEFRLTNTEKRKEFLGRVQEMFSQRFEMAVRNIERLQVRVGGVIDKLKTDDGENTANATNYLNLSKEKLIEAKIKIAAIKALVPDTGEKVTPEVFEQIKLGARIAKDLLKESHGYLKDAIREIKGLRGENTES